MNDRFKFRGIRLDNKQFYYGSLLYLHNATEYKWNGDKHTTNKDVYFIIDKNDINYAVDPKTICQCTGLKDKNGELVYDGDILRCRNEQIFKLVFETGSCGFLLYEQKTDEYFYPCYNTDQFKNRNICEMEIIGNIYENKELLK